MLQEYQTMTHAKMKHKFFKKLWSRKRKRLEKRKKADLSLFWHDKHQQQHIVSINIFNIFNITLYTMYENSL